jgi:hypothetical protein
MMGKKYYTIPMKIIKRDGPFDEFKQDASIVSIQLEDNTIFEHVLVLYPNYIISMQDKNEVPFDTSKISKVFQTESDLNMRSSSDWIFFPYPGDGSEKN